MATFPTLNRQQIDDRQPDTGLSLVRAPNGQQFGQSFYDEEYWFFNPVFVGLSEADALNLQAFYEANKILSFDFVYSNRGSASITYECQFIDGLRIIPNEAQRYTAQAFFRGRIKP